MRHKVEIGILYSRSGPYDLLGETARAGALAAIEEINSDPARSLEIIPVERDPKGDIDRYAALCEDILTNSSARHLVGCITSSSRKEVIPVLEKRDATLWYGAPYEGFEASENVVYMHACPNQHLVPLIAYLAPRFGARAYLTGSNYIWGWEMNRVARDLVADAGGAILGERYLPLGSEDVGRLITEIEATEPDFILNNLIGPSSYAFFRAYQALGLRNSSFRAGRRPIVSCNLTEVELPALGSAGEGHISVGPYFDGSGPALKKSVFTPGHGGGEKRHSSFGVAAHSAVTVLAATIENTMTERSQNIAGDYPAIPGLLTAESLSGLRFQTALGEITIDPHTRHAALPVRIGQVTGDRFRIIESLEEPLAADPYLSRYNHATMGLRPSLRVVS